jgi:ferric-dicitrate binding protein FerR (iron transport regulator)
MKQVKERLSALVSGFFNKKSSRSEIAEFSNIIKEIPDEVLYDVLEQSWETYEGIEGSFEDRRKRLKHKIDYKNQSNQKKRLGFRPFYDIIVKVAAILVFSVSGFALYQSFNNAELKNKTIAVATRPGERVTIELPDGSKVELNAASKLTYSSNFNQQNRIVTLEGEAYFDIKKSTTDKFVVQTATHAVEVMGTQFNVQSYNPEEHFEVTLLTGKVKVNKINDHTNAIILKPNEKYEFDYKTQKLTVNKADLENETAWLRGELVIKEKPLGHAINQIERFYGLVINDSSIANLENKVFTGSFKKGNVEDALKVISLVYPVKYSKSNDSITLTLTKH